MLSTFKQKLSAVMLCLSLVFSQTHVNAITINDVKPSANKQMLFVLAAPFIDGIYKNNKNLRSWAGIKTLWALTKAQYKSAFSAKDVAPRKIDETKAQFIQRAAKEYAKANPTLSAAGTLAIVSVLHALLTEGAKQVATTAIDLVVADLKQVGDVASEIASEIGHGLPATRNRISLTAAAAATATGLKKP